MLVALQEGSKVAKYRFSWRWKAVRVNGGSAGGAAVVDYITAGGAVEVNYGAAGRQQGVGLAAGGSSKISVSCGQSSNG